MLLLLLLPEVGCHPWGELFHIQALEADEELPSPLCLLGSQGTETSLVEGEELEGRDGTAPGSTHQIR